MPRNSLKTKALALLARREYTRSELEKKLRAWVLRPKVDAQSDGFDEMQDGKEQITILLDELQNKNILSDERALESILNQKTPRFGAVRIKQVLLNKGLDVGLVQSALDQLKNTEFERALVTWQRKFSMTPIDASSYNKQARFLIYRGFSSEVIKKVLSHTKAISSD